MEKLAYGKRNAERVLRGALICGMVRANTYFSSDDKAIREILKVKSEQQSSWGYERALEAVSALRGAAEDQLPTLVYALFGDSAKDCWSDSYRKAYPKHNVSAKLKGLYDWLVALGYKMSEEEKTLLDGTHELFHQDSTTASNQPAEPREP